MILGLVQPAGAAGPASTGPESPGAAVHIGTADEVTSSDSASISGRILNLVGSNDVFLYRLTDDDWDYIASTSEDDDNPQFSFSGLEAGTYTLYFGNGCADEWLGGVQTGAEAQRIVLADAEQRTGVDVTLGGDASVSGTVTGSGAGPLTDVDIYASKVDDGGWSMDKCLRAVTDSAGAFTIVGLAAGTYLLQYEGHKIGYADEWWNDTYWDDEATRFDVGAGQSLTGLDATLTPGATLSGSVFGADGGGLTNVQVVAYRSVLNGDFPEYWNEVFWSSHDWDDDFWSTRTDQSGGYSIAGLQTGKYTLRFLVPDGSSYASEWWNGRPSRGEAESIDVVAGQNLAMSATKMQPGSSVSGRLTSDGVGVTGTSVSLYRWGLTDQGWTGWFSDQQAQTDAAGNYTFWGVQPGTYTLGFAFSDDEYWHDQASLSTADTFTLARGQKLAGMDASPGIQVAVAAATPTISGVVKVGSTLTAAPGIWGPAPVTLKYQWRADSAAIAGATATSYTIPTTMRGKRITVTVTGSKTGYTTVARTSASTAAVVAGTLAAPTPKITGAAKVGLILKAVPGTWGPSPVTLKYQWKGNGTAISGATGSTYKIAASYAGKKITLTVTGSKTGYTTAAKTSTSTATVAKGTLSPAPTPTISGTVKVGSTLTAKPGTWGPAPVTLKYQWKANGSAIRGATSSKYRIATSLVGRKITVSVTGTRTGYTPAIKVSRATAAVKR